MNSLERETILNQLTSARKLFADASASYPASVTAQSLFIARRCQELGLEPDNLCELILDDQPSIDLLLKTARSAHLASKRTIKKIDESELTEIIETDFKIAQKFMDVLPQKLSEICDSYDKFHGRNRKFAHIRSREREYDRFVKSITGIGIEESAPKVDRVFDSQR